MPRHVDHAERRRELIDVATDLVLDRGRASLTVRNVAAAAGWSTKVVSHYFDDMAELLHATYDAAAVRARERLRAVTERDPDDVQGFIEALLPMDTERTRDWRIWFAFWSEALSSERLRADQRQRARGTNERLEATLGRLAEAGRLGPIHDVHAAAHRLGALVQGIAAQAVFDPTGWPPAQQRHVVATELAMLGLRRSRT